MKNLVASKSWYMGKPAEVIPLADILCLTPIDLRVVHLLRESIQRDGLKNPIIVVRCTVQDVIQNAEHGRLDLPDTFWEDYSDHPGAEVLVVCGGANRMQAAHELQYEGVSAVFARSFTEARAIQAIQRDLMDWFGRVDIQIAPESLQGASEAVPATSALPTP